jgi:hypothetical protein
LKPGFAAPVPQPRDRPQRALGRGRLILGSLLGLAFSFPWASSPAPAALLVLAGALGKGLGGRAGGSVRLVGALLGCALALWFGLRLAHLSRGPKPQHAE